VEKRSSRSRFFTAGARRDSARGPVRVAAARPAENTVSTADTAPCGVPYGRQRFRSGDGELRLSRSQRLSSRSAFRGLHAGAAALRAFEFALLVIDVSFEFFHGDFAAFAGHEVRIAWLRDQGSRADEGVRPTSLGSRFGDRGKNGVDGNSGAVE